jgi:hypothetical protein
MTEARDLSPSPPAGVPALPKSKQSITFGKPPIDPNASGRRARLRHPARGGVRR